MIDHPCLPRYPWGMAKPYKLQGEGPNRGEGGKFASPPQPLSPQPDEARQRAVRTGFSVDQLGVPDHPPSEKKDWPPAGPAIDHGGKPFRFTGQ